MDARLYAGARPQRLLWVSTGTKDPKASDVLVRQGPWPQSTFTVKLPVTPLKALADHGDVGETIPATAAPEEQLARSAGIDVQRIIDPASRRRCQVIHDPWNDPDGCDWAPSRPHALKRAS